MEQLSFQEYYADEFSFCFGCGTNNSKGHRLKTYWDGDKTVSEFAPELYHTSLPGFVYGGLLASLIDCHSTATGSAALHKSLPEIKKKQTYPRCVTAQLNVCYLFPTPIGCTLKLIGTIKELKGRKVVVGVELSAKGKITVKGEVVVVQVSNNWQPKA